MLHIRIKQIQVLSLLFVSGLIAPASALADSDQSRVFEEYLFEVLEPLADGNCKDEDLPSKSGCYLCVSSGANPPTYYWQLQTNIEKLCDSLFPDATWVD